MINISIKSLPHRANGFRGNNLRHFFSIFAFWFPWQPIKNGYDRKLWYSGNISSEFCQNI